MKKSKKNSGKASLGAVLALVASILALVAVAGLLWKQMNPDYQRLDMNGNYCTQDVRQCPDGSYVGRRGTRCEFAKCPDEKVGGTQCTLEAKICPDGSAVGRTGPNCEFTPCPGEASRN